MHGILEPLNRVVLDYKIVVHADLAQGSGLEELTSLNRCVIINLTKPHEPCVGFKDQVIGGVSITLNISPL